VEISRIDDSVLRGVVSNSREPAAQALVRCRVVDRERSAGGPDRRRRMCAILAEITGSSSGHSSIEPNSVSMLRRKRSATPNWPLSDASRPLSAANEYPWPGPPGRGTANEAVDKHPAVCAEMRPSAGPSKCRRSRWGCCPIRIRKRLDRPEGEAPVGIRHATAAASLTSVPTTDAVTSMG